MRQGGYPATGAGAREQGRSRRTAVKTAEAVEAAQVAKLERGSRSFIALYEHWERNQWSPLALDFAVDALSYHALDDAGRRALLWLFAHRFDAEESVARLLAPFLLAAPDEETRLLMATQVADEHRHVQAVVRVYQEVFGLSGGIKEVAALAEKNSSPLERELFDQLDAPVMALVEGFDEYRYARAVFAYHVIGEGVMARASQNLSTGQFRTLGEFPGLLAGQRHVALDESRHIGIGLTYLKRALIRSPEIVRESIAQALADWQQIALATVVRALHETNGEVARGYGVDPQGFFAEAMSLLTMRLRALGLADLVPAAW
jgi:ribonucleotide reductase beta subunit family protein with ferritin-like domain